MALAPYCVPIYTFFVLMVYWGFKKFHPFGFLDPLFMITVGISLSFHSSLTLFAVRQEQPDIKKTGAFFSLVFILLANCWILVFLCKVLFWNVIPMKEFFLETLRTQGEIWEWVWGKCSEFCKINVP